MSLCNFFSGDEPNLDQFYQHSRQLCSTMFADFMPQGLEVSEHMLPEVQLH
jgi:hypothetical protein